MPHVPLGIFLFKTAFPESAMFLPEASKSQAAVSRENITRKEIHQNHVSEQLLVIYRFRDNMFSNLV